jgi:hypothetical protein
MTGAGLSKSLFIRGLQCHKALYLARFRPELKDPVPPSRELLFEGGFEAGVLQSLADWFPETAPKVDRLIANLHDLAVPFQQRSYYHWRFHGSYSLKAVLPVMAPDLSYEGLAVKNGEMATLAYLNMQRTKDPGELDRIRQDLLAYCRLDTLAMVRIVEALRALL